MKKPLAEVDEIAYLKVVSKTSIGAFVDFGLERDVFVPMKEQKYEIAMWVAAFEFELEIDAEGAKFIF